MFFFLLQICDELPSASPGKQGKIRKSGKIAFYFILLKIQSIGLANQILPVFSIFLCFLGDIRQQFMAYQQQKSRFYRAEPTKPRFFSFFFQICHDLPHASPRKQGKFGTTGKIKFYLLITL